MRLKRLVLFSFLAFSFKSFSQWTEQLIYQDPISGSAKIVLVDLDNDGLKDIVTFRGQSAIYWHINLNGAGNFSSPILIVDNLSTVRGMAVGDLIGNSFKDIVYSTQDVLNPGFNLWWMEHLDGAGTFGNPQIIFEDPATRARAIVLADIDGDGMLDIVVSASADSDRSITWYRNLGNGNFSSGNVVISGFSNGFGIAVGDIDGDGFLDIVSGTSNTGVMSWFKNLDGQGNFSAPIPIGSSGNPGYNVLWLHLVDIDGDGDLDVVGSSANTQAFAWWENLDGQGNFSSEKFIELNYPITVFYPADIDNDGDIDLFAISPVSPPGTLGNMFWYENLDGLGSFSSPHIITETLVNAITIEAMDVNSNGSIDPVSASQTNRTIVWFENNLLSTEDFDANKLIIYPNPVKDTLQLKTKEILHYFVIYSVSGQLIKSKSLENSTREIDVSFLTPGMYVLVLKNQKGEEKIKFVKQ